MYCCGISQSSSLPDLMTVSLFILSVVKWRGRLPPNKSASSVSNIIYKVSNGIKSDLSFVHSFRACVREASNLVGR